MTQCTGVSPTYNRTRVTNRAGDMEAKERRTTHLTRSGVSVSVTETVRVEVRLRVDVTELVAVDVRLSVCVDEIV